MFGLTVTYNLAHTPTHPFPEGESPIGNERITSGLRDGNDWGGWSVGAGLDADG